MGGSKCQWSRLVVVPLSVLLPRPPAGSFVERLSEIQACLYMSKYSALHTYSASSLPENFHGSPEHVHQRAEKGHMLSSGSECIASLPLG